MDTSGVRKIALAILAMLALGACSPPEQGRVVRDVAVSPDGEVVEIDSGGYWESEAPTTDTTELVEVGTKSEACLGSGTCFRLVDERQIEQSTNGWASSEVVWKISPNASWWGHEYDDGYNKMVIGLFDIVVLPDQTVAVASGQLPLVERSLDGEWTPTVADLRTLPSTALFLVPAGVMLILALGLAFTEHQGTSVARAAAFFLAVGCLAILVIAVLALKSIVFVLFAFFILMPMGLLGIGLLAGAILRARHASDYWRTVGPSFAVATVGAVAAWFGTYALWATDRISWGMTNLLWLVALGLAVGVAMMAATSVTGSGPGTAPLVEKPTTLAATIWIGLLVMPVSVVAGAFVSTFLAGVIPGRLLVWVLFVALGVGLVAKRTLRIPYEPAEFVRDQESYVLDRMHPPRT